MLIAAMLLAAAPRVWACATCGCGDPTLTASGVEQPYKNRVRLSLEERYFDHVMGPEHSYVMRTAVALGWSPVSRLTVGLYVPWMTSWVVQPQRTDLISGLGDMELSARVLVARDRKFAAHHLFWLNGGLKMPTGPRIDDDQGYPYSDDDQPGSGSWDPFGGLTYAWFSGDMWSAFGSASYRYTTTGPRGYRRGSVLGWTTAAQLQPWSYLAFTAGVNGRWEQPDLLANGNASPDTGGVIVTLAPGVLVSPRPDVLLRLLVDVPVVKVLNGNQQIGPQVMLTLNWDVR
jgi:hypothetical protein